MVWGDTKSKMATKEVTSVLKFQMEHVNLLNVFFKGLPRLYFISATLVLVDLEFSLTDSTTPSSTFSFIQDLSGSISK